MLKKKGIIGLVLITTLVFLTGCTSEEKKNALNDFEQAKEVVEKLNVDLDKLVSESEELILKKEAALDVSTLSNLETIVSSTKSKKAVIPDTPKDVEEIINETEKLKNIDYTEITSELSTAMSLYQNSIKQLYQVTSPTEAFVIQRLQEVSGITGISAVTEDNDPNGNLGKAKSYTAQVFFSYELVNQSELFGDSIIEKGTSAGGSVEVYVSTEDATTRNQYLSNFDGGIFAPGSHTVLGTLVVRTSDELTASQQKELEAKIIASLIELR